MTARIQKPILAQDSFPSWIDAIFPTADQNFSSNSILKLSNGLNPESELFDSAKQMGQKRSEDAQANLLGGKRFTQILRLYI